MLELSSFFRRFYFFRIKSKAHRFVVSANKSFKLPVQVDTERVRFVNVKDIDHLQIDQSKTQLELRGQLSLPPNVQKIVQLWYRQSIHRIRMV